MKTLINIQKLSKDFEIKKLFTKSKTLKAVNQISFHINENETLGLVGESGCGKSTLAKLLTQLESPTSGSMKYLGKHFHELKRSDFHSSIQMVFQDPYQSLNPRKKAFDIIAEPLRINTNKNSEEIEQEVLSMMKKVGLREEFKNRYPHHFSGGQRQRLGIARALMLRPKLLILDEPVSALDVSIQAQVLNLLLELQKEFSLSYLFISHDLSVVRHMSDNIMVMYLGKIVEMGTRDLVFNEPKHPYTKLLLESAPELKSKKNLSQKNEFSFSEAISPLNLPKGCTFFDRCSQRSEKCKEQAPEASMFEERVISCHHPL
jgi:dipeptide transport system ATP-binding protein